MLHYMISAPPREEKTYVYIYIYTHIHCVYTHICIHNVDIDHTDYYHYYYHHHHYYYGQFSQFHVCFCGLDSGNLKFETVRTHKQAICF